MNIVAVIPAYNEGPRVAAAVKDAKAYCDAVVVVDDCSKDETGQAALSSGAFVLRHIVNRGQGAALQTGTDFAVQSLGADIIVHFDADGQMRGEEIPMMAQPIIDNQADIVLGSRFLGAQAENMPRSRKITLWLGLLFTVLVSGIKLTDTHNGFRALSRATAQKIRISLDRMAHASEILDLIVAKRLHYVERPVHIRYSEETLTKSRENLGKSASGAVRIVTDLMKKKIVG